MSDVRSIFNGKKTALLLVAMGLTTSFFSCSDDNPKPEPKIEKNEVISVVAHKIVPQKFVQMLTLTGIAKANRSVVIASETSGKVVKVGFKKGDDAKKGEPLVWLDSSLLEADIAQAQAGMEINELEYRKLKALARKKASVSEIQLDKSRLSLNVAKARLQGLHSRLAKKTIKAPFDGKIARKNVEIGAIVNPGEPLAKVIDLKAIKVVVGIPEVAIADFNPGKKASIVFDAFPEKKFKGVTSYISPEVDMRSRTFELELKLTNGKIKISPEMSAKVTFVKRELANSILIPQTSVLERREGHAVFIINSQNIAQLKPVIIEDSSGEMALVKSGVSIGDLLVIKGQRGLTSGDTVEAIME